MCKAFEVFLCTEATQYRWSDTEPKQDTGHPAQLSSAQGEEGGLGFPKHQWE